jgi:hypothetical protein
MKGFSFFRSFPGLARSFSESSFNHVDEHTTWVKWKWEGKTEVFGEQTRLNAALSATNPTWSGRDRNETTAVSSQRMTLDF